MGDDGDCRFDQSLVALMDVVAIIIGLVSFVILLAFIEGVERV